MSLGRDLSERQFLLPSPWRTVVLGDPPVAVAPDQHPGHPVGTWRVAVGEFDEAGRDFHIGCDVPHPWQG